MTDLTCRLIESKPFFSDLIDSDGSEPIPNDDTKSFMASSGTTPAISWMSRGVIGAGGSVEEASLEAD